MRLAPSTLRPTVLMTTLLCLPGAAMLTLLMLGVEPPLGPLTPLVASPASGPNVVGTAIALTVILLLPAIALGMSVPRLFFSGGSITPARMLVAAGPACIILLFVLAVVADQYPCWVGVPNCD